MRTLLALNGKESSTSQHWRCIQSISHLVLTSSPRTMVVVGKICHDPDSLLYERACGQRLPKNRVFQMIWHLAPFDLTMCSLLPFDRTIACSGIQDVQEEDFQEQPGIMQSRVASCLCAQLMHKNASVPADYNPAYVLVRVHKTCHGDRDGEAARLTEKRGAGTRLAILSGHVHRRGS